MNYLISLLEELILHVATQSNNSFSRFGMYQPKMKK